MWCEVGAVHLELGMLCNIGFGNVSGLREEHGTGAYCTKLFEMLERCVKVQGSYLYHSVSQPRAQGCHEPL